MARIPAFALFFAAIAPLAALALDAPPHPTLLVAEYRGGTYPVVAVQGETPVALVEGKLKKLSGRIPLQTNRVAGFCATRAQLILGQIANLQIVTAASEHEIEQVVGTPGATIGGYVEFNATVTAERDLKDCYVAFVSFSAGFLAGSTDRPAAQIRVRQIADLPARQPVKIKFSTEPFLGDSREQKVFVLLFSGAEEVFTGGNTIAWRYFQQREQVIHRAAVAAWIKRHAGETQPARPSLQFPPVFSAAPTLPAEVAADLQVGADGRVVAVNLPTGLAPRAREEISRTLHAWLFLPQLASGSPVASRVRVPLQF
jgi:hypothetical protein